MGGMHVIDHVFDGARCCIGGIGQTDVHPCVDQNDQPKRRSRLHDAFIADVVKVGLLIVGMELDTLNPHRFHAFEFGLVAFKVWMHGAKRKDVLMLLVNLSGKVVAGDHLLCGGCDRLKDGVLDVCMCHGLRKSQQRAVRVSLRMGKALQMRNDL